MNACNFKMKWKKIHPGMDNESQPCIIKQLLKFNVTTIKS